MKKVVLFSAFILGMCACTTRAVSTVSENDSTVVDSIEVVDTLSVDTLAVVAE